MENKKMSILLVDDHPILREGVSQLLESQSFVGEIYQAENAQNALMIFDSHTIDFLIADISLKGMSGLDLIKIIRKENPRLLILVLSMHDATLYGERSLRAGANGYLMKSENPSKIIDAIQCIIEEGIYLNSEISKNILKGMVSGYSSATRTEWSSLTDREVEVLTYVGEGFSTKIIAKKLGLSFKTINSHCDNLKKKLGVCDKNNLLQKAIVFAQEHRNKT